MSTIKSVPKLYSDKPLSREKCLHCDKGQIHGTDTDNEPKVAEEWPIFHGGFWKNVDRLDLGGGRGGCGGKKRLAVLSPSLPW